MKKFENKAEFENGLVEFIKQRILGQNLNLPTDWEIADGNYKVDFFNNNYSKRLSMGEWSDDETVEIIKVCIHNSENSFTKIIPIIRNPYSNSWGEFEFNGIHYNEKDGEFKTSEF